MAYPDAGLGVLAERVRELVRALGEVREVGVLEAGDAFGLDLEAVVPGERDAPERRGARARRRSSGPTRSRPRYRPARARGERRFHPLLEPRLGRVVDDRRQRPVVVEEERERAAGELAAEPGLDVLRVDRTDARGRARGAKEVVEPGVDVVRALAEAEGAHPRAPLDGLHRERLVEGVRDGVDVVRVHLDRLAHRLRGAGELRQDQDARLADLRGHVLLRDQVHAVAERCHQRDRRVAVEDGELLRVGGAVDVADRRPGRGAEAAVHGPTSSSISRFSRWYSGTSPRLGSAIWSSTTRPACSGWTSKRRSKARIRSGMPFV